MTAEDVTCHKFGWRHIFQCSLREDLACHLSLSEFIQESVFKFWIHLEGVAESHLFFFKTCCESELLVDEVGSEDCVSCFHRVGCGEVVVFTCVDDDASEAVDDT